MTSERRDQEVQAGARANEDVTAPARSMPASAERPVHAAPSRARGRRIKVFAVMAVVVIAWLILDQVSKAYFDAYEVGAIMGGPYLGIFQLHLVHNTGMAWGMFGNSTLALGVVSLIVCGFFLVYAFISAPHMNWAQVIGLALVIAGGIGNAIDRFSIGYVVDFIEPVFMDFPVFNIADIGVTCGFIIFLIGLFFNMSAEGKNDAETGRHARVEREG